MNESFTMNEEDDKSVASSAFDDVPSDLENLLEEAGAPSEMSMEEESEEKIIRGRRRRREEEEEEDIQRQAPPFRSQPAQPPILRFYPREEGPESGPPGSDHFISSM